MGDLRDTQFTTHTRCGLATRFYAKNVRVSTGQMIVFTYYIVFTCLRLYSILMRLHKYHLNRVSSFSYSIMFMIKEASMFDVTYQKVFILSRTMFLKVNILIFSQKCFIGFGRIKLFDVFLQRNS